MSRASAASGTTLARGPAFSIERSILRHRRAARRAACAARSRCVIAVVDAEQAQAHGLAVMQAAGPAIVLHHVLPCRRAVADEGAERLRRELVDALEWSLAAVQAWRAGAMRAGMLARQWLACKRISSARSEVAPAPLSGLECARARFHPGQPGYVPSVKGPARRRGIPRYESDPMSAAVTTERAEARKTEAPRGAPDGGALRAHLRGRVHRLDHRSPTASSGWFGLPHNVELVLASVKGIVFVAVTATLLLLLGLRYFRNLEALAGAVHAAVRERGGGPHRLHGRARPRGRADRRRAGRHEPDAAGARRA